MSVVELEAPPVVEDARVLTEPEQVWAKFMADLEPWEIHHLHVIGELTHHDLYMDGKIKLLDVFAAVQDKCGCVRCRVKETGGEGK